MAKDNMPDHEWCDGCGKLVHKSYMTDSICQDCINERDTEEDEIGEPLVEKEWVTEEAN